MTLNLQDTTAEEFGVVDLAAEDETVRRAVTVIARLLGAPIEHPGPHDLSSFVAFHLGADAADVSAVGKILTGIAWPLVRVELARRLEAATSTVLRDDTGVNAPGYSLVDVDEQIAAPDDLAAYVPAGELFDFDVVAVVHWIGRFPRIALHVRRSDAAAARGALAELHAAACAEHNFYRGRTVRAVPDGPGVDLIPVRPAKSSRAEVIHADAIWTEIDANVGGLARHGATLVAAGLGAGRGVLVAGPPGVGKTALCRVIATEVPAGTTVVLVEPGLHPHALKTLYDVLPDLAPAAVFLDDIDLLAGNREHGDEGPALGEFLTQLDGFRPAAPVLTVATTNVTARLDPALLRPGRFDAILEVGPPDADARAQILRRFLDPICSVDVGPVVRCTDGTTGADLREIVRRAVLEHGAEITSNVLADIARSGRWKPKPSVGQYL